MFKTFKFGGIHPNDNKVLSKNKKIERLPLPKFVNIPLSMHIGAPAKFICNIGDKVKTGQLIAEKSSFVSANIHSSVDGIIKEIKKTLMPQGNYVDSVVIEVEQESNENFDKKNNFNLSLVSKEEIINIIEKAGIVGMGGAAFPTSVKYNVNEQNKIEYLFINACECEPYLTCDYRLIVEKKSEIIEGIKILKKLFNNPLTYFCTEKNKKEEALELKKLDVDNVFTLEILKNKYPQGDEKSIINAITKREVPSGKLPLDVGCVVVNLGTIFSIYEAIYYDKPLIERVVTVSGDGIGETKNILCPIGATVKDLINFCGGLKDNTAKIISGGPMMGFSFYDLNTPITKATSGITVLREEKSKKIFPCISCGRCAAACPMRLVPTQMYKYIMNDRVEDAISINLLDCRECGCCQYSCPSGIKLVQGFKVGKKIWRKINESK